METADIWRDATRGDLDFRRSGISPDRGTLAGRLKWVCVLLLFFGPILLVAQSATLDRHRAEYKWLERARIQTADAAMLMPRHSPSLYPMERSELLREALALEAYVPSGAVGDFRLRHLASVFAVGDSTDRRDRSFYPTPYNLLEVNGADFYLRLNPLLDLRYGKMQDDAEDYFYNRRGVDLWGGLDQKLHFHFQLLETQRSLPAYLRSFRQQTESVPGAGFVKNYSLSLAHVSRGVDYLQSVGYLGFQISKHVGARFGYGNHFIGRGERSLLLSDFSNNYPFLQLNWRVWKLHYQNLFTELTNSPAFDTGEPGQPLPKKYLAAHYLGLHIGKRLEVGLYEAVVFNRDSGFEWGYLNPVILYRTVEQSLGSPDNVLLGLNASYTLPPHWLLYGQAVIDEFKFDEVFGDRPGWWANKFGYQLGLKYIQAFGLPWLDLAVERNSVRPYTYSHSTGLSNYAHFGMPLAHPLGANFSETVLQVDYQPLERLQLAARLYLIDQGESVDGQAVGEEVTRPSSDRSADYGHKTGQGAAYRTRLLLAEASYMLKANLFLEATFLSRDKNSELAVRDQQTTYLYLGLRWNVAKRRDMF